MQALLRNQRQARWRKRHPEKAAAIRRNAQLKTKYGITAAQYEILLESQNGVCAICKQPPHGWGQHATIRLGTDHDHATGRVRGLLCQNCNATLGQAHDDPEILRRAADYLENYKCQHY